MKRKDVVELLLVTQWFMKASAVWVGAGGVFGIFFYSVYVHHMIAVLREEST